MHWLYHLVPCADHSSFFDCFSVVLIVVKLQSVSCNSLFCQRLGKYHFMRCESGSSLINHFQILASSCTPTGVLTNVNKSTEDKFINTKTLLFLPLLKA